MLEGMFSSFATSTLGGLLFILTDASFPPWGPSPRKHCDPCVSSWDKTSMGQKFTSQSPLSSLLPACLPGRTPLGDVTSLHMSAEYTGDRPQILWNLRTATSACLITCDPKCQQVCLLSPEEGVGLCRFLLLLYLKGQLSCLKKFHTETLAYKTHKS